MKEIFGGITDGIKGGISKVFMEITVFLLVLFIK